MKKCKKCKADFDEKLKKCPNCGSAQGLKTWQIVVIVIVAIAIVGGALGEESSSNSKSKKNDEEKTTTTTTTPEEKEYLVGEVVPVGKVEYTVNSTSTATTVGTQYLNTTAKNVFLIVNVTLKNNGTEALTVSNDYFKLKLGEKTYESDSTASIYDNGNGGFIYEEINPDGSLTGNVIFDVTQETIDNQDLKLQVQTGYWGTETGLIKLH